MRLHPGDRFPEHTATTQRGEVVSLHAPGRPTVIWFYPMDFTSG